MLFPLTEKITSLNPPASLLEMLIISIVHFFFEQTFSYRNRFVTEDVRFVIVKNSKVLTHRIKFWLSTSQTLNLESIHFFWMEVDISIEWHKNKIGNEIEKSVALNTPTINVKQLSLVFRIKIVTLYRFYYYCKHHSSDH